MRNARLLGDFKLDRALRFLLHDSGPWRDTLTVASAEHPKFGEIARSELEPDDVRIWPMT
jgi:hypothetical protein